MNSELNIIDAKMIRFCDEIAEHHMVNIRVFITKTEKGQGQMITRSSGDPYSTYGAIKEWITREEERTRQTVNAE
jgi:hypothetical protein